MNVGKLLTAKKGLRAQQRTDNLCPLDALLFYWALARQSKLALCHNF